MGRWMWPLRLRLGVREPVLTGDFIRRDRVVTGHGGCKFGGLKLVEPGFGASDLDAGGRRAAG